MTGGPSVVTGGPSPSLLGPDERRALLAHARACIDAALSGRAAPEPPRGGSLDQERGAFVTLRRRADHELRGCVGLVTADRPLTEVVAHVAVSAALHDGRFEPVEAAELKALAIEISVLGPLAPVGPHDIRLGETGLIIRARGRQGLLLPRVPLDHGWDVPTFLERACRKAGLDASAWRDPDAEIQGFRCEVFDEDEDEEEASHS